LVEPLLKDWRYILLEIIKFYIFKKKKKKKLLEIIKFYKFKKKKKKKYDII